MQTRGILSVITELFKGYGWYFVLMTVLGGAGTFAGPLVGAAAFFGLEQLVTRWTQDWMIVLGALLAPVVILFPRGIVGTVEAAIRRRRARG